MSKITFGKVLKNNLKCALCKHKNCSVRYFPERTKNHYINGTRYVTRCIKDNRKKK